MVEQLRDISCPPGQPFCEFRHIDPPSSVKPLVTEIRFEGVPESIAKVLHSNYDHWIGGPLDMEKVADAVKALSVGDDFASVEDVRLHGRDRSSIL